jgi:hypothetical protein
MGAGAGGRLHEAALAADLCIGDMPHPPVDEQDQFHHHS